jgi:hypothetical protein
VIRHRIHAIVLALVGAALLPPIGALAQDRPAVRGPANPHAWELAGTIDLRTDPQDTRLLPLNVEFGRYWTTHWRTDARTIVGTPGVSASVSYELFGRAATRPYGSIGIETLSSSSSSGVAVRPFVASGVKRYIGGRAFIRTDVMIPVDSLTNPAATFGVRNRVFHAGVGIDF